MKPTAFFSLIIAFLFSVIAYSQQTIKGSNSISGVGGSSYLTYDWSAQVSYVQKNNQVYVNVTNWKITTSANSNYLFQGKEYSRNELAFSSWPCSDNTSGSKSITLTVNASGKTISIPVSENEGYIGTVNELPNVNFSTYKVTSTNDFWVNGKGCKEVEEKILAQKNQTSNNSSSSNSNSNSNTNTNKENSASSNSSNVNSSSESSSALRLKTAEENMRDVGIDPNEDYLGNTISMGATFIEDMFSMAAENRRKKALELERQIAEIKAEYADYKDNYRQLINKNIDSANNGNLNSMLQVGWGNYRLGNSIEAEKWFKKLVSLDQPIGYYYLGQMEEDKIVHGHMQGDKFVYNKNKEEQLAYMLNAISFYKKSADLGFEESSNYLMCLYLELQFSNSWDGRIVIEDLYAQISNQQLLDRLNYCYHGIIEIIYPHKGLKDFENAKKVALNAEKFGNFKPIKILSNYIQYYDKKASKEFVKVDKHIENKDYQSAFELCKKYADLYYIPAMKKLSQFYLNESFGQINSVESFRLTLLAAHLGDYDSMDNLSKIFKNGLKVNDAFIIEPSIELSDLWMQAATQAKSANTLN